MPHCMVQHLVGNTCSASAVQSGSSGALSGSGLCSNPSSPSFAQADHCSLHWAATEHSVLHGMFQRLRPQHLLCSAAATALQTMKFSICSVSNFSALLCRAVTTDDEDVAKQAIEVWNTIAEEEIDRQQVSLTDHLSSRSSTGQVCKLPTLLQGAPSTLTVPARTAIMAVQTPT